MRTSAQTRRVRRRRLDAALYIYTLVVATLATALLVAAGVHEHREHVTWHGVGPGVHPGAWFLALVALYLVGAFARLLRPRRRGLR